MAPITRSRGYLPHLESEKPVYFVTFRLADSLPREVLSQLRSQREMTENAHRAGVHSRADAVRQQERRALLRKAESYLDSGLGKCYMRDSRIARIVVDAICHFDGQRYQLIAWCVMPNHVHVVFSPATGQRLQAIVHSWKSFSALAANRVLRRSGHFWQREYFDHLVRTDEALVRIIRYVKGNPAKAGLRNWPWVGGYLATP